MVSQPHGPDPFRDDEEPLRRAVEAIDRALASGKVPERYRLWVRTGRRFITAAERAAERDAKGPKP